LRLRSRAWKARADPAARATIFAGPDFFLGVAVALVGVASALGWALASGGWTAGVAGGAVFLVLAAGFRHRVAIDAAGVRYARTWMGLAWRRRRFPLDVKIEIWSTPDDPDGHGVVLGDDEKVVLDPRRDRVAGLRREMIDAIAKVREPRD
jgi:hypothetical protein